MREERGQVAGDMIVYEPFELWGTVGGNVTVVDGGKFYLRGTIYGNLIIEHGGRCHIYGQIKGNVLVERKAKVIHSGTIGGDLTNNGGRLFIERVAKVGGKTRTHDGETKVEPPPRAAREDA